MDRNGTYTTLYNDNANTHTHPTNTPHQQSNPPINYPRWLHFQLDLVSMVSIVARCCALTLILDI